MKTLKQHIDEKLKQAQDLISVLKNGYVDENGNFRKGPEMDSEEIMDYVEKRFSVKQIGSGVSAVAMASGKDPEYILRITGSIDENWEAYAKTCMKMYGKNPFYPKILYSGRHGPAGSDEITVGIIEAVKVDYEYHYDMVTTSTEHFGDHDPFWKWSIEMREWAMARIEDPSYKGNHKDSDEQAALKIAKDIGWPEDKWTAWFKAVYGANGWHYDVHAENLGRRKNGEWVVFDP